MFLASENIDFTGLSHVFLLGGGEVVAFLFLYSKNGEYKLVFVLFRPGFQFIALESRSFAASI